jgi:hypothetical protein
MTKPAECKAVGWPIVPAFTPRFDMGCFNNRTGAFLYPFAGWQIFSDIFRACSYWYGYHYILSGRQDFQDKLDFLLLSQFPDETEKINPFSAVPNGPALDSCAFYPFLSLRVTLFKKYNFGKTLHFVYLWECR